MRAIGYRTPGDIDAAESLVDIELPRPEPGPRDLLVEVRAVSVNPVDTKIRRRAAADAGGWKVLGWDAAGSCSTSAPTCRASRPATRSSTPAP